MVTTASHFWETLGNLPPHYSVSCSYTVKGEPAPSGASSAAPSRGNITTSPGSMVEAHTVIGCSFEKKMEIRKRSPERRYSVLKDRNNPGGVVENFFGVGFPLVKRRRVPVQSTRVASDIPTPDVERMNVLLQPKIGGLDKGAAVLSRRHLVRETSRVGASPSVAPTPARPWRHDKIGDKSVNERPSITDSTRHRRPLALPAASKYGSDRGPERELESHVY